MTAPVEVFREQTQELSPTGEPFGFVTHKTKPAPDRDNLNRLINGLLRRAKSFPGGGTSFKQPATQKSKYPATKAGAKQAFTDGDYDEASRIAVQIGMSMADF